MISAWSCTDDFDEINTNPNTLSSDQLDASMAGPSFANALYKGIHQGSNTGVYDDHGTYGLITMLHSMLFVHYMSSTSEGWATDRNGINDGWRARGWTRFYTMAAPSLINAYDAAAGDDEALAVLDIWKVYMYHKVTDHWGPVPYSQAAIGGASVPYDDQETMYADFFTLLEKADSTLEASSETTVGLFASYDRIYGGEIAKWRKFANSLRLRLALRISDIDATEAKSQAEAAIDAGVMESNDESAYFEVSDYTDNNFTKIAPSWGFAMTASMESILEGYDDPRLSVWFSPSATGGIYTGQPNGGGESRNWKTDTLSYVNEAIFGYDERAVKPIEIMMAAETYFNRAEGMLNGWDMGSGTAQSMYEEGITLSMNQWEITDNTAISAYINGSSLPTEPDLAAEYTAAGLSATPHVQLPVAWSSTEADQRTQITVQKYLALFPESWEAWSDLRRTDADILYPLLTTENTDSEVGRGLMKRLTYLPNEYSTNAEAVDAAVATLPGSQDRGGAHVWWDVD